MSKLPLAGLTILNTRPIAAAARLSAQIINLGGTAVELPTIAITPLTTQLAALIPRLAEFDMLIFMSSNAVIYSIPALLPYWNSLVEPPLLGAVGKATAQTLQGYGLNVTMLPAIDSSEGLLVTAALQQVKQKRILIVRGHNGRKLLDNSLQQRGALVEELIVYRRDLPTDLPNLALLEQGAVDIILCTSIESLQNLFRLICHTAAAKLQHIPWLCISQRVATQVRNAGVARVYTAANSDMLQSLINWVQQREDIHYA